MLVETHEQSMNQLETHDHFRGILRQRHMHAFAVYEKRKLNTNKIARHERAAEFADPCPWTTSMDYLNGLP